MYLHRKVYFYDGGVFSGLGVGFRVPGGPRRLFFHHAPEKNFMPQLIRSNNSSNFFVQRGSLRIKLFSDLKK